MIKTQNETKKDPARTPFSTKILYVGGNPLKLLTIWSMYQNDTMSMYKVSFWKKISHHYPSEHFRDPMRDLMRIITEGNSLCYMIH
ncbi:MAG: hypothetical protein EBT20_20000 [Alphaproteobacteria bacterium]|nr:hypothetical protein [Alphaproteobacteria bacterium]